MNKQMMKRVLIVILAIVMLCGNLSLLTWVDVKAGTISEEMYTDDSIGLVSSDVETPIPETDPQVGGGPEQLDTQALSPTPEEPEQLDTQTPSPTSEELEPLYTQTPSPTSETPISEVETPKEIPFTSGYGIVDRGTKLYENPNGKNVLGNFTANGIVYAAEFVEKEGEWYHVYFAGEADNGFQKYDGYIKTDYLNPLDEKMVQTEIEVLLLNEETTCFYDQEESIPLAVLDFEWNDTQQQDVTKEKEDADGINSTPEALPDETVGSESTTPGVPDQKEPDTMGNGEDEPHEGSEIDQEETDVEEEPNTAELGDDHPIIDIVYDPQPQTIDEVQTAIDTYNQECFTIIEELGAEAASQVRKPRWQYEVPEDLMPIGYECVLVNDDEDFTADYYTFILGESEPEEVLADEQIVEFDPQPQTLEEVRAAIDAYEEEYYTVLQRDGFLVAIMVNKPHWQYQVSEEIMPAGYHCELINDDERFGVEYYTFFASPMPLGFGTSGYKIAPPQGTDITNLFTLIGQAERDPDYINVARITEDKSDRQGIMWSKTKLDLYSPFSTKMKLYLGHMDPVPNEDAPADGMTFTMHNDPRGASAIGGFGEGLGVYRGRTAGDYGEGRHMENALVIEFDTYRNDGTGNGTVTDPNVGPHCALVIPKRGASASNDRITVQDHINYFGFTVKQDWVLFEVSWTPSLNNGILGGTLKYTFDGVSKTHDIANVQTIFNGTTVWWGFSGSTGAQTALQAAAIEKLPFPQVDPTYDFAFVKVDAEDDEILLANAKFLLYSCADGSTGHVHDEMAVTGSCWMVVTPLNARSGADGVVLFEELKPGDYQLVETEPPNGYQLPLGQWRFSISDSGVIEFKALNGTKPPAFKQISSSNGSSYLLGNIKQFTIPLTGGQDMFFIMVAGILLIMFGITALGVYRRFSRNNSKNDSVGMERFQ